MSGVLLLLLLAPTPAEAREAARRVLADPGYQTEWPADVPAASTGPRGPDWRLPDVDLPDLPDVDFDPPDLSPGLDFASIFLWVVGGAAAAILLFYLWTELRGRRAGRAPPAARVAVPAPSPPPLAPAERLAAEGDYAGAIHALLLQAFARLEVPLRDSWTSREVLLHVQLDPAARTALEELVGAVEVTRYGGAGADARDYERCVGWADAVGRSQA